MDANEELRAATGVAGLDELLYGGLIAGRLYLIDGEPGAGKTTLALQFLLEGLRRGERCLYVTLSESAAELRAGAKSHGWSLEGIEIVELIAQDRELDGEDELTMYHPSEVELTETTRRVFDAVARANPHRMVFDSLSELRLLAQNTLRYRRQILAIKQFFVARECTVLLLDDRTTGDPDEQVQSVAHGVVSLEQRSPVYGPALRQIRIAKLRGSDFRSGFQDMLITRGGIQVFPRLQSSEHGVDFIRETVPSGVAGIDALLGGGIDCGTTTLLVGAPGTGKSTIALQYASAAAARGGHAAIFTFEETMSIMLGRAKAIGMTVHEGREPGQVMVRQINPGEVLPAEFTAMVRQSVENDGARIVVMDSLNGYMNAMPEKRALIIQLHELLSYLNNHGVATFLVATHSGVIGSPAYNPVDASYLADTVILFRMYEHVGEVKKAMSVIKKRSGKHEETIRQLWLDADGLNVGAPLKHLRGVLTGVPVEADSTENSERLRRSGDVV